MTDPVSPTSPVYQSHPRQRQIAERMNARARRKPPSQRQLERWLNEGGCEATDGCWVEPDGTCPHGCESWLLNLGMI